MEVQGYFCNKKDGCSVGFFCLGCVVVKGM